LICAAYNPSLASLGVTAYQILPFWREFAPDIFSLHLSNFVGMVMCAEWKMVGFRRTSSMGNYPLLLDLSVAAISFSRRYLKKFKGTQHRYGKLGRIDTGACFLALPSTRQSRTFDSDVHHRLQ